MRYILISSGSLFHVAAAHLGDASRWEEIARLNELSDPVITGLIRLRLPSTATEDIGRAGR